MIAEWAGQHTSMTPAAVNDAATIYNLLGCDTLSFQAIGTFSYTLVVEVTNGDPTAPATTWLSSLPFVSSAGITSASTTSAGIYVANVAGYRSARVKVSAFTSNTSGVVTLVATRGVSIRPTSGNQGDAATAVYLPATGAYIFNGTTWDRLRSADGASGGNAGIAAAGLMGYNGTNWFRNTIGNLAGDAFDTNSLAIAVQGLNRVFNGTSWDRQRSPGLGTLAIGCFRTAIKSTPTVGTGTIYASGDVIGTKNTLANASRLSGAGGIIRSVTVASKNAVADIAIALRAWFFDSDPSGSTFTDNGALNIVDADITKVIGFIDIPGTGGAATSGQVWSVRACDLSFVASGSTSIYMVLEARGAVAANAGTTDFQITATIEQD